ncbi:MAG: helix-turn-helix transcriptional regulator [Phenylobacterium sp.]|uniref:helix-turn-helix domain-containing protein n=1 Tax=Phenylobacterium sp. TaxID=1871053 RepID=UPI001A625FF3|nr:helix-turn-helix transcriptional regulator [Phenylobacterium sp.]MBL8556006.1 helix-turn-helix transcriptional regulator [Phenylobacterium sp.]
MTDVNAFVGRRMRRRRRLMGLTQQDLAAACGVTFQQVQKYESASTRLTVERLWRVARALQVDVAYFFIGLAHEDLSPRGLGGAAARIGA